VVAVGTSPVVQWVDAPGGATGSEKGWVSLLIDLSWRDRGACRGLDPGVFYPAEEDDPSEAKSICGSCVVQSTCLEHALRHREKEGVWGGCTERERRRIIRQRRRSA
jgi:WhiB family transcriptional regulator, redox-sensing transcriptional regulator